MENPSIFALILSFVLVVTLASLPIVLVYIHNIGVRNMVKQHIFNCTLVAIIVLVTMVLFKYLQSVAAEVATLNNLVSISIHNNEGDTVQTFSGRLSSIESGYRYLRFIDEGNVEHEIYYTDYISVKKDEVTE